MCVPLALFVVVAHADELPADAPAPATAAMVESEKPSPPVDQSAIGNISELYRDKKKATASINQSMVVPLSVSVLTGTGEACEGRVESADSNQLALDFTNCADFEKIKVGASVRKSPFQTLPPANVKEISMPEPSRFRIGFDLSVGYSSSTELRFDSADFYNGSSSTIGSDIFTVGTAGQVSLGVMMATPHSWGGYAGLTLQQKRDVKFERTEINGATVYAISNSTMDFNFIEVSGFYRWSYAYLPFGLNYSIVDVGLPPGTGLSITMSGGLGAQLGAGFFFTDHIHLEVLSQALATRIKVKGAGASADLGTGFLSGLTVKLGYLF